MQIMACSEIQMESERSYGKSFIWKINYEEKQWPLKTVYRTKIFEKENKPPKRKDHKIDFLQHYIEIIKVERINDESQLVNWMDAKIKVKEFNISTNDRPKMASIADYWSEKEKQEM